MNHLSTVRKRNRRDSPSRGDRKGKSTNLIRDLIRVKAYTVAYEGLRGQPAPNVRLAVKEDIDSGTVLGRLTEGGESPVREMNIRLTG